MHTVRTLKRKIIAMVVGAGSVVALAGASPSYAADGGRPSATNQYGANLYVSNRDSRKMAVFGLDRTGLPNRGPPSVATGGEPRGIAVSLDGTSAYVVNSTTNTISAYAIGRGGAPRPLSAVPTKGKFPFSIAIAPNGRSLYVSNLFSGTLSAFAVNTDGTLTQLGPPVKDAADNPRGLAVSADSRFLFVGHGLPDDSGTDVVTTFAIDGDGRLRAVDRPAPAGGAGTGMAVSPDGRFLYVVSTSADAVFGYRIGPAGRLHPLPGSPFPVADYPEGAAITADGRHLYVTSPGPDRTNPGHSVSAYTIGADGALTPVAGSPFAAGEGPAGVAVTPDGRHLYVANYDSSTISTFTIAPSGALQEIYGSPVPSGGSRPAFQSVAVLPDMYR